MLPFVLTILIVMRPHAIRTTIPASHESKIQVKSPNYDGAGKPLDHTSGEHRRSSKEVAAILANMHMQK